MIKYEISKDRIGLLKYFTKDNGEDSFYHIHSNELNDSEKDILKAFLDLMGN